MQVSTFIDATEFLNNQSFKQISGDELFATFQTDKGKTAFVWANGVKSSDGYTIEFN